MKTTYAGCDRENVNSCTYELSRRDEELKTLCEEISERLSSDGKVLGVNLREVMMPDVEGVEKVPKRWQQSYLSTIGDRKLRLRSVLFESKMPRNHANS
ncbi:hypothetical protein BPOR_0038g00200 [Botrytis porri]|uniref:Uncharacterized protein n=1 Tax=Botrytis porri TaxID=87229 RepID=A0A4Z1L2T7_9HELO|nr:hypothetical protein BPOR_0038g00200 [Botrytis porri]